MNAALATADQATVVIPSVGRPLRRNQVSAALATTYRTLAWQPVDPVGGFLYHDFVSWSHLITALVDETRQTLRTSGLPTGWLAEEEAELEKGLVCWRDRGYGSLVYLHAPVTSSTRQEYLLRGAVRQLSDLLVKAVRAGGLPGRLPIQIPTAKGKGAPLWAPGTDREAAIALATPYATDMALDDIDDWLEGFAHRGIGGCLTSYMRGQGGRKPAPYIKPVGNSLHVVGERVMMKVRRVDGFSFAKQLGAAAYHTTLRELMNHVLPFTKGTVQNVMREFPKFRYAYATDVSTFDDSISWQLQDTVTRLLHEPLSRAMADAGLITHKEAAYTVDYERWIPEAPILAPSPRAFEDVHLVRRKGGVPSGSRGTSNNDTLYNLARIHACHAELGYTAQVHVFGDDTLLLSKQPLPKGYVEWNQAAGFTLKLAQAPIFLQRIMPLGCTLLSRMLIACVNREARFEPTSVLHLAVGVRVRHTLLRGHPLQHAFWRVLEKVAAVTGNERLSTALLIAKSPSPTEQLMQDLAETNVPTERLEDVALWADELGIDIPGLSLRHVNSQEELSTLAHTATHMERSDLRRILGRYGNK